VLRVYPLRIPTFSTQQVVQEDATG
jgi:hypothetical protein